MNSIIISNLFIVLFVKHAYRASDITPRELKCEYLTEPLAIEKRHPRLSWTVTEVDSTKQNLSQSAYQILVASNKALLTNNIGDLWDTGKVASNNTVHIYYNGVALKARQRAYWKVRIWDQNDSPSDYSSATKWEVGLIDANSWISKWIAAPEGLQHNATLNISTVDADLIKSKPGLIPAVYLRKSFKASNTSTVKEARLYATARGVYRLFINGEEVDSSYLNPGWTNFNKTQQYQAYDVTHIIASNNTISMILGTGWFSAYIGFNKTYGYYGHEQFALVQLHIEYDNAESAIITSDDTWRVSTGPIIYSDLLHGELYYDNCTLHGWMFPSYNDSGWLTAVESEISTNIDMVADRAEPIRVTEELTPKTVIEVTTGVYVFDLGQNMVGWAKIKIRNERNLTSIIRIQLRYAEMLYRNGSIYTLNLRSARATDTYVFDGNQFTDIYEPHFTFHGFRYIEVTGYPGVPQLTDIVGRVAHSDTPINGKFESSNEMVNQLSRNIVWGQRGNFFSVPTDCPQRDERLGWMGDAQIFAQTATFNADVAPFYTKWLRDVREAQTDEGGYPDVAPRLVDFSDGAPAWGDAGIIVPYTVWRMYGDTDIIEENFVNMAKWISYVQTANTDLIWRNRISHEYSDWLQIDANTPEDVLATAYFAYDALLLSRMANAINRTEDSKKYLELFHRISNAFNKAFVNSTDAKIKGDTQTVYLLSLAFELLPESLRAPVAKHLVDNIQQHDWHLTTGFVGVGYLCPVLTQFGHNDVAYRLLLTDTFPSWGYSIKYGATTIWERWDGWTAEKGFQSPSMNSFNHYSLGSVGQWLYRSVAGIDTDDTQIGFQKIVIKPQPGEGVTHVSAQYNSIRGLIKTNWRTTGDQFSLNVTIPANTRAVVDLSFANQSEIHEIGSGVYHFQVKWK